MELAATGEKFRQLAHAAGRELLRLGAQLLTAGRIEPSNPMVAVIDRLMCTPNSRLRRTLAPNLVDQRSPDDSPDLTMLERRALIVAVAAIAVDRPGRAVEVLEEPIDECSSRIHPRVYERLAEAQLKVANGSMAEEVLRQGLDVYPKDAGLRLALANVYASAQSWDAALAHWDLVPAIVRARARVAIQIGIARAYRHTGSPNKAAAVARGAAELWPQNEELRRELRRCRPFLIDWPASWTSSTELTGEIAASCNTVESMGFLFGGASPLRGCLGQNDTQDPEVLLVVNGRPVTSTIAARTSQESPDKTFNINCADILKYLGDGDTVQVVCGNSAALLPMLGTSAILRCGFDSEIDAVFEKLNDGFVFTKNGRLRPGHNAESKRALVEMFVHVSELITASSGQPVYPFYGNLLGTIRENDLIKHDVGGFDMLYLCKDDKPADVKAEVAKLYGLLLEHGFHLNVKPHSIMIRRKRGDVEFLDLSYGWFNQLEEFNVSFGWRFDSVRGRDRFVDSRYCRLLKCEIPVPGNSEDVLEQLYGPQWRVPDQGFSTDSLLRRDSAYLLSEAEILSLGSSKAGVVEEVGAMRRQPRN